MAAISKRVSERISKESRKFQRILTDAKDRDINESDTVVIITDMLSSIFGFDKYTEITSEFAIRSVYCDLAVKIEENVKYLIEVKAIGLDLKESHLNQAVGYGAQHGVQWVMLTNGIIWEIYRIKFDRPIGHELLCSFNFLDLNPRKAEDQDILFLLCKEGLTKAAIEEYHEHVKSVNRFIIGAILQSETGLKLIRKELKMVSPGVRVELDEIQAIVRSEVLKRDVVEGDFADKAKARVKKAASRALAKRKAKEEQRDAASLDLGEPDV